MGESSRLRKLVMNDTEKMKDQSTAKVKLPSCLSSSIEPQPTPSPCKIHLHIASKRLGKAGQRGQLAKEHFEGHYSANSSTVATGREALVMPVCQPVTVQTSIQL